MATSNKLFSPEWMASTAGICGLGNGRVGLRCRYVYYLDLIHSIYPSEITENAPERVERAAAGSGGKARRDGGRRADKRGRSNVVII